MLVQEEAKPASSNVAMQKYLDIIDYTMVLTISPCNCDAKNTADTPKHVPDQF